jgi:Transposase
VKTDRRDAMPLARLMRAGDLTPVEVAAVEDEASRDLARARAEAMRARKAAQNRLTAFLLAQPPKALQALSWNAQGRRGPRDRRLWARGTHAHQGVVAMARERVGCMGAMATQLAVPPSTHGLR